MADEPSPEQLDQLVELQDTDLAIRRLEHQLDDLAEQRALDEAQAEIDATDRRRAELRVELDGVRSMASRLEGDLELLTQRKAAETQRMYGGEIHTARELQSLRAELDATEKRIDEHETDLLEVMERREELDGADADLAERAEHLAARIEELAAARDEAAQGILAQLGELKASRERKRIQLDDELLARYDAATERFAGAAIGELQDGMCTACRIQLPVAEVNELYVGGPLGNCPNCRRLLVVR